MMYSYEVVAATDVAMELVYTCEGYGTHHIGARLPYEGETLEDVARMYAPIGQWNEEKAVKQSVQVGATGTVYPLPVDKAAEVRFARNRLLAECDWTQLADSGLTAEKLQQWADYRQALRDVPAQAGFPDVVQWPTIDNSIPVTTL